MGALEFISHTRFHQSLTLPPNPRTNRTTPFRITYADYGSPHSANVVLFCGALFGMRLSYSILDKLAKEHDVRIIHPDRPGVGGTDGVELEGRVGMWLEIVPKLLEHLDVKHVSLASHSAGTIYLINTILAYPELLHPQRPYVCFFAPFVHHAHSKVAKLAATEFLTEGMIAKLSPLARFVNTNVLPVSAVSVNVLRGAKGFLSGASRASVAGMNAEDDGKETLDLDLDNPDVVVQLRKHITTFLFAESTSGVSDDAQLLLRRPHTTVWCSPDIQWADIDAVPPLLSRIIDEEVPKRRWVVDTFHAESDHMVGEKGREWFDKCWAEGEFEYRSQTVEGGDHDFLIDPIFGASRVWLGRVRDAFAGPEGS